MYQQNRILHRANELAARSPKNRLILGASEMTFFKRYWPLLAMILVMIGTWASRWYSPTVAERGLFISYSTQGGSANLPKTCDATFDGAALESYQHDFKAALVCGIGDPTIDPFKNTAIAVSQPFSIQQGPMTVSTPFSNAMANHVAAHLTSAVTGISKGSMATESFELWFQVIVMPNSGCDIADIHELADVTRCGGRLMPEVRALMDYINGPIS